MKFKQYLTETTSEQIRKWAKEHLRFQFSDGEVHHYKDWTKSSREWFVEEYFKTNGHHVWFDPKVEKLFTIAFEGVVPPMRGDMWEFNSDQVPHDHGIDVAFSDIIIPDFLCLPVETTSIVFEDEFSIQIKSFKNIQRYAPKLKEIYLDEDIFSQCVVGVLPLLKLQNFKGTTFNSGVTFNTKFAKALKILNNHLENKDIIECQDELIDAGLDDFAKL